MMVLTAYLGEAGFLRWASWMVIASVATPQALLWGRGSCGTGRW